LTKVVTDLVVGAKGGIERGKSGVEDFHIINLKGDVGLVGDLTLPGDAEVTEVGIEAGSDHGDVFGIFEEVATGGGGVEKADLAGSSSDALGGRIKGGEGS